MAKRKNKFRTNGSKAAGTAITEYAEEELSAPGDPTQKATSQSNSLALDIVNKLNGLRLWQVVAIIALVGFAVYFSGLDNPFIGDDQLQIVNNPIVHSISNIRIFFEGGTFYNSGGSPALFGTYYRPLMTVVFSLLYTFFGPNPIFYHLLQLTLCVASAIILFLIFQYFFDSTVVALVMSLVFLVHPANSQLAFAIPTMQDALFFFFGVLAFWVVLTHKSSASSVIAAGLIFLSLLSKESGVLFLAMILLYFFLNDRKRMMPFVAMILPLAGVYIALYAKAIGFGPHAAIAPIDGLSLVGRLMTMPSLLVFYFTKFVFPLKLASAYYWTDPGFSLSHTLLPLAIDVVVVTVIAMVFINIRKNQPTNTFRVFLLFSAWVAFGLLLHMQIVPLDMTASESWLYFPMAGALGLIGMIIVTYQHKLNAKWFVGIASLVLVLLAVRTALRGTDWSSVSDLSTHDIQASKEDYVAYSALSAAELNDDANATAAVKYGQQSISIYPFFDNYYNLGSAYEQTGDYGAAKQAFLDALKYGQPGQIYENLAWLTLVSGDYSQNQQLIAFCLRRYPHDPTLLSYKAVLEERYGDNQDAKADILKATVYGAQDPAAYNGILSDKPFTVTIDSAGHTISVP